MLHRIQQECQKIASKTIFSITASTGEQNTLAASSLNKSAVPYGWRDVGLAPLE